MDTGEPALVSRMAYALRECIDLSIAPSRVYHYERAGFSAEQITEHDRKAKIYEEARRRTFPEKKPTIAGIVARVAATTGLLALGMFITGFASTFPEPAMAAEAIAPASSLSPLHIAIAVGLAFAFFAWVIVWILDRIEIGPIIGGEEYGPEPTRDQAYREAEGAE